MVEEVRVPGDYLFAADLELPVLGVVEGAVDGAACYGSAGVEDAGGVRWGLFIFLGDGLGWFTGLLGANCCLLAI